MASRDETTHVFIVRVWRELREPEDAPPEWRGYIEHIASREKRYVRTLDEIATFVASYLEQMGIRLPRKRQIRRWLERQTGFAPKKD